MKHHNPSLSSSLPISFFAIFFLVLLASDPAIGFSSGKRSREIEEWSTPEGGSVVSLVKKENRREIVSTEYGQITAVVIADPVAKRAGESMNYHLQFISLDPNSLFLPVLLHADMVFYVQTGSGKLSFTEEGEKDTKQVKLERGDVFRLKSGSIFYIRSSLEPQRERLRINAMFSNSIRDQGALEEQWVGPYSRIQDLVQGFDSRILQAAFQAPKEVIEEITNSTRTPPIVHAESHSKEKKDDDSSLWANEVTQYMKRAVLFDFEPADQDNKKKKKKKKGDSKSTETFNFFKEDRDVENCNGWSTMVTQKNLRSLEGSHIGVFMVNLTAGSMMGPHWNPTAVEVGVVLEGEGMVMAVCSSSSGIECNNTRVMVEEGDVFAVPRFHPMTQMSFNNGTLVFMGFSTSNKYNHPQFLAGKASVLQTLRKAAVLEAAFNVNETTIGRLLDAQEELTILECLSCAEDERRIMEVEIEELRREEELRRKEEEERKRQKEEEKRRREEEEARRQEEEEEQRKQKEEEARRQQEEEEEQRRQKEEEEARRKQEEEEAQRRQDEKKRREQEEEERRRQEEEEEEERRRQKEEEEARRQQEEEEAQRRQQKEKKRREKEEEERRRQEEEEEEERRRQKEEEEARRQQEEEERRRHEEEEEARRQQEEQQRRQEEARREQEEEEKRRYEEEEAEQRRQEEAARRQQEEEERRRRQEEEREREQEEETEEEIARREEEEREREWEWDEPTRRQRRRERRTPPPEEWEEEEGARPEVWREPEARRPYYEETTRRRGEEEWEEPETRRPYYEETTTRRGEEEWKEPRIRRQRPYYEEESEEEMARKEEEERRMERATVS